MAGTVELYPAVENDGLIEGVELEGGGTGSTGDFTDVHLHSGTFELADGAALTNVTLDGGTVNVTGTVTASGAMSAGTLGGAGTFHVNGPFTWSGGSMGGTGTTRVTSTLTHTANTSLNDTRVLAIEGTLEMAGDGRYINRTGTPVVKNTGTIKRTAAGAVELYPALDNDGRVEGVDLEGGGSGSTGEFVAVKFKAGTFDLERRDADGVAFNGGTVNAVGTVTASGATTMTSGTLGGTGTFVLGGTVAWSGGQMTSAGTTRITGTLTHTANTSLSAGRVLAVEGTLDMAGDGRAINGAGGAAIRVTGTFKRTGTGTNSTTAAVDNDGLVQDIELNGGGKDVSTGEFAGAALRGGTFALGTGAKLTGDAGITGATVNVTGTVAVAGRFTGGTLGGAGTPEITGTLEWTGGKMAGPGTTRVAQGGTLILNGIASLTAGRVLENRGLIDARGTATIFDDFEDPAERIENLGTIRKTAGTSSTIGVPLHNAGVVDGKVGELRVEDGTPEADTGTFTGTDAANRVVFVGERTFTGAVQLTGFSEIADDITVQGGRHAHAGRHRRAARRQADRQRHRHRPDQLGRRPPVRPGHHDRGRRRPDRRHAAGRVRLRLGLARRRAQARHQRPAAPGEGRGPEHVRRAALDDRQRRADRARDAATTTPAAIRPGSAATRCCATPARSRRSAAQAARTCGSSSTTTARSTGRSSSTATRRSRTRARSRTSGSATACS